MKAYVGVTDKAWADFLSERPQLNEINFWRPSSASVFKRIELGDLFLFKTHFPQNQIVGGAVFSGFARVPLSEAWATFGQGNGRDSVVEVRAAINSYRAKNKMAAIQPGEDPLIGCIMLRDPVFFSANTTFDPPPDFAKSLVQGKGYDDIESAAHAHYFAPIAARVLRRPPEKALEEDRSEETDTWRRSGPIFGEARPTRRRLGQGAFQLALLEAYQNSCAITGQRVRPVLEAAHIHPVTKGGLHRLDNGLLLRSDVHRLFDLGYLTVSPDLTVRISPRLHRDFPDAQEYAALGGVRIQLPEKKADHPSHEALAWHQSEVFQAV
ncbi:putative restriction endonuclease [Nocardiopsis sp. Huas11]|uniref:HNH endonuclease n=1 Tax=Nocardiopsis sp. Huas11 TaxID=2183912 RepID=UPI000EB381CD|nr:HNH endonuclease [Nocardiopsis sp. Huas11]RKS08186.1 putative restriction endonuclease [Nocardiopsis sp. Huas11]